MLCGKKNKNQNNNKGESDKILAGTYQRDPWTAGQTNRAFSDCFLRSGFALQGFCNARQKTSEDKAEQAPVDQDSEFTSRKAAAHAVNSAEEQTNLLHMLHVLGFSLRGGKQPREAAACAWWNWKSLFVSKSGVLQLYSQNGLEWTETKGDFEWRWECPEEVWTLELGFESVDGRSGAQSGSRRHCGCHQRQVSKGTAI